MSHFVTECTTLQSGSNSRTLDWSLIQDLVLTTSRDASPKASSGSWGQKPGFVTIEVKYCITQ